MMTRIDDIAEVNPRLPKHIDKNGDLATFLPMSAVSESGRITSLESKPISEVYKGYSYFEEGDVLFAKITPCMENGKAAFVEDIPHPIGFGSTEFHVLRPGPKLFGRYLFHMVWNPQFRFIAEKNMTGSAGQKRVPTDFVRSYSIPLPPLDEQRRIAAILDKADAVRRKRQEALRLTEDLLRSVFLDMFGGAENPYDWPVKSISEIADKKTGSCIIGPFGSNLKVSDYRKEGHPVIFVRDIRSGTFNWKSNVYVDNSKFHELNSHLAFPLDVLATKMGDPPCISAVYPELAEPAVITADIIRVTPDTQICSPYYLTYAINSQYCKKQVELITEGGTRPKVTLKNFRSLKILLPPMELQNNWMHYIFKMKSFTERLEKTHSNHCNLFNSLVQRAFRGEL